MNKKLFLLLLLSLTCFAQRLSGRPVYYKHNPLSAKNAREILLEAEHDKHREEIDKWIKKIDDAIIWESNNSNAFFTVDVTSADMEVQTYLYLIYENEGYHSELIPGWVGEDLGHRGGHPDGKTYLGLSW